MLDKVMIRGLKCPCIIGIWEWERQVRQELQIDLDLLLDTGKAAASDDFDFTVSYAAVSELVISKCADSQFQLIEALATYLVDAVFEKFPLIESLRLEIKKPGAVPEADYVGIELQRSR
jgi:7,8-dihydroneopterin aldolase/epimerase/oxygenase